MFRQPPTNGNNAIINSYQISGELDLGQPNKDENQRLARIFFNCKVDARVSFFQCTV